MLSSAALTQKQSAMKIKSNPRLTHETLTPPSQTSLPSPTAAVVAREESPWLAHPLPRAAESMSRQGPLEGKPVLSPLGVQLHPYASPDGVGFLQAQLRDIERKTAQGESVMVVFDLDNTLFDTRARTLQAARAFDALHQSEWFVGLELSQVRVDGEQTARGVKNPPLPDHVVKAFAAYWDQEFWNPDNLRHDGAMEETLAWAKAAQAAGAEVRYLTGRTAGFSAASLAQLRRAGLNVEASQLCCKPNVGVPTAPFKAEVLQAWNETMPVAWFLTEGLRDLEHVQNALPELATVRLDCSFEDDGAHSLSPHTPRLPRVF